MQGYILKRMAYHILRNIWAILCECTWKISEFMVGHLFKNKENKSVCMYFVSFLLEFACFWCKSKQSLDQSTGTDKYNN
jgi:hypothetical protein